ncbi:hypothetical protein ACR9VJ_26480 [Streptomyces sp. H49]|uniref:hypothetical protein n=1 Tax=Streptomyces sp. H49 TaxID=3444117 RepID=UPI003F4A8D38
MRLRDAKEQVEREHPELTGSAKLEAIKALRAKAAEAVEPQEKTPAAAGRHCAHCNQDVKPVEKRGWAHLLAWLMLLEFGSIIAAIVNAVSRFSADSAGGGVGRLILWPAAVHPAWLGLVASIVAFLAVTTLAGTVSRRASDKATCPICHQTLKADA